MSLVINLPPAETEGGEAVSAALRKVMSHAVAGHDQTQGSGFTHTYCNDSEHALEILLDEGVVSFVLDEDPEGVLDF